MLIRQAEEKDIGLLKGIVAAMKARHEDNYVERCMAEQTEKRRTILLAEENSQGLGYAMVNWLPLYPPFRRLGIPEIQDLNVIPGARRQGLGARLVEACEKTAAQVGKTEIGISVGLHAGFGAAQRLYVRCGYVPDGAGLMHDETPVVAGEMRPVDDVLTLKLIKNL
ncbi:MAG: GNAT family N-acetyltransferase [Alphaproteobacteria bacterium]|nr:MAG: GNAT family N-acetyltransferase [Alphaproteobacteria bacterium]